MTEDEIIAFAAGLPGVTVETASAGSGAPEVAWGDSFVYYDPPGAEPEPPDRRWPFATLVIHDYAGFDESSRLDRDGVLADHLKRASPVGEPANKPTFLQRGD